jgi:trk system potassium uptake protein TrkA
MKLLIVGAGQVGRTVAKSLAADHEVVAMDTDPERLDKLRSNTDVMIYEGDGTSIEDLKQVNAGEMDTIVASTDDDQTNIMICSTARALNQSIQTIARVKQTAYLQSWQHSNRAFNVSFMVGADQLTAQDIFRVSGLQTARDVEFFSRGRIEMAEFDVPEDCFLVGREIQEVDTVSGLTFAAAFSVESIC